MFGDRGRCHPGSVYEANNIKPKGLRAVQRRLALHRRQRADAGGGACAAERRAARPGDARVARPLPAGRLQAPPAPDRAGEGAPAPKSASNGAAMRSIAPVAWAFDTLAEVLAAAERFTVPDARSPGRRKGAQATAAAGIPQRRREQDHTIRQHRTGPATTSGAFLPLRPTMFDLPCGHGAACDPRLPRSRGFRGSQVQRRLHRRRFGHRQPASPARSPRRIGAACRRLSRARKYLPADAPLVRWRKGLRRSRGAALRCRPTRRRIAATIRWLSLTLPGVWAGTAASSAENGPPASTARSCEKALKPKKPCALPMPELLTPPKGRFWCAYCCRHRVDAEAARTRFGAQRSTAPASRLHR